MDEKYNHINGLLENWKLYSESLDKRDIESLNILNYSLKFLSAKEQIYLYDVYFLGKTYLKKFHNSYEISHSDILEKIKTIYDEFIRVEEIKKNEQEEKIKNTLLMNEAKAYLVPFRSLTVPVVNQWEYILAMEKMIDSINNSKYISILKARYISKQFMKEISMNLQCGIRKASKLHDEALKEFGKVLRQETRR